MTFLESLGVDVFGFSVVFAVLIALSLVVKLISVVVGSVRKKALPEAQAVAVQEDEGPQFADGELKLFDVDERTAALIMAIVSDESGIPLSQLRFTSIRLIK
jgi:Na+-transporting methylmalonyl-CoA/oxaloacetate decarboxylase gamma subunit